MKNQLRLAILLSMILSACASSPPSDAEVAILFNEAGCELIKAPEGDLSNPIRIAAKNPTEKVYALVIVTLRAGFTRADLESYKGDGIPPSVDRIIDHMDPDLKGGWLVEELPIDSNTEYFVVCAQEDVGILSVPLTLNP
jgi:ABC-type Fe3+-hydroxamate transport system substrate-binding protein